MKDFTVFALDIHLAASKRKSYREHAIRYYQILAEFLQKHDLLTRRLLEPSEFPDAEFKVMRSDLTDEGYELVKGGYQEWARKVEKGMPPEDTSILERELAKIRDKH